MDQIRVIIREIAIVEGGVIEVLTPGCITGTSPGLPAYANVCNPILEVAQIGPAPAVQTFEIGPLSEKCVAGTS